MVLAVGPSRDATLEIARGWLPATGRVTVVANPSGLIPAASNAAIKASRFPIVARVDGHALIPPGYLKLAVQTLQETGAADVGGIMAAQGVTPFEQAVAWAMTSPAGVGSSRFHTGRSVGPADTVYLGVYRRAALEQMGGYDEAYHRAEDWELNHRIRLAGGLIWFQPGLRVTYRPRGSVRALAVQYFNYGRWRRAVCREHAGTVNLRYLAPPAAVAAITAGLAAAITGLVAYLIASSVGPAGAAGAAGVTGAARGWPGPRWPGSCWASWSRRPIWPGSSRRPAWPRACCPSAWSHASPRPWSPCTSAGESASSPAPATSSPASGPPASASAAADRLPS